MRIWHKDLIDVLPDKQLRGQWRECCLIAKALHDGNLNYLLVNKVKECNIFDFCCYSLEIRAEMIIRGMKGNIAAFGKYMPCGWLHDANKVDISDVFDGWHNDRYLRQCLYNLQEKYDCGRFIFEIIDIDGHQIDKVLVTDLGPEEEIKEGK